jgi:hypothetical protein
MEYPYWVETELDKIKYNQAVTRHIQGREGYPDYVTTDDDKVRFNLAITHYNIQNINRTINIPNRIIEKTKSTLEKLVSFPKKVRDLSCLT